MVYRISWGSVLYFTKFTVYLACTWPPSKYANKRDAMKYNIAWCISFLSGILFLLPLFVSMFIYRSNSLILTQSACLSGAIANLLVKMIVYRIYIKRTQTLIYEMENFLQKAQPNEEIIIQRYIDRCLYFHAFISILNYLTPAMAGFAPLFMSEVPLPSNAVYPFSVDAGVAMFLVYIHQVVVGFQCASGVTIDCQAALMMWYAGARIEILTEELKYVTDINGFDYFIRKHRKLLSYAIEVSNTMSYIALTSSTTCGIAAIMSSLQLFGNQPLGVKIQFGPIALITTLNLFICTWPAENLIYVCDNLGTSVYNSPWIDMPLGMMKNFLFLLGRCQRVVIVSVAGFLPTLSMRSYGSFLSAIFSYFTTLRLVVTSSDEK